MTYQKPSPRLLRLVYVVKVLLYDIIAYSLPVLLIHKNLTFISGELFGRVE